jgi:hypothetical protein
VYNVQYTSLLLYAETRGETLKQRAVAMAIKKKLKSCEVATAKATIVVCAAFVEKFALL